MTVINYVTPKAAAKHDFLFNKPASGAYPKVELVKGALLGKALYITTSRLDIYKVLRI